MPWPLDGTGGAYLPLYLVTLLLHAVLVGYVVAGTAVTLHGAARGRSSPLTAAARDGLPLALGLAITAGVAPLLFVQLLYQHRFYTANLLVGPRHLAIVPALIVGFYALYLGKADWPGRRLRTSALALALLAFAFVAWSWTDVHLLMQRDPAWAELYQRASWWSGDERVWVRWAGWLAATVPSFAAVVSWQLDDSPAHAAARRRLGLAAAVAAGVALVLAWRVYVGQTDLAAAGMERARPYLVVLVGASAVEIAAWLWCAARPDQRAAHTLATAATVAALAGGVVVREAARLHQLEPTRAAVTDAGGAWAFVVAAVVLVLALWHISRVIRNGRA